ncbi:MotE family protein [Acetobacter sp.]|jgi:flagellar motility protein MotE (MotC chaperone)|uniref:MotE family protein n=1 Tax=Acetobacter sp. TaxID=440 RepID=UPI0025BACEA7|nr:hypothetical protein [Acetobacter sp.]MCH4092190.1 hypothetical protein [Acetobacter sp.]MCI1299893.1 hypothetical protein [Acetobacter sp.]MCI1315911.1 hypothetical protein [Acetobacter sp.]
MPKLPFSRIFQLSSCLMGGLLSLKLYLLTSSLLFANTPDGAAAIAEQGKSQTAKPTDAAPSSGDAASPAPSSDGKVSANAGADKAQAAKSPCLDGMTCIGQQNKPELDVDHNADEARTALLQDLAGRTKQLEQESQSLEELKRSIDASQAVLEQRMQKYSEQQAVVKNQAKQKQQLSDADVDRLVKIYEAMAPRDAASIFNVLDFQVVVPVMTKMNPRKASAILAGMVPERAMMATQLLAGVPRRSPVVRIGTNG